MIRNFLIRMYLLKYNSVIGLRTPNFGKVHSQFW